MKRKTFCLAESSLNVTDFVKLETLYHTCINFKKFFYFIYLI